MMHPLDGAMRSTSCCSNTRAIAARIGCVRAPGNHQNRLWTRQSQTCSAVVGSSSAVSAQGPAAVARTAYAKASAVKSVFVASS
jgi:hypothetical protein